MLNKSRKLDSPADNLTAERLYSPATLPLVAAPYQQPVDPATIKMQQPNAAATVKNKNRQYGMKEEAGLWLAMVLIFFLHVLEKLKVLK